MNSMRWTLRNQNKIKQALGSQFLFGLLNSLVAYFEETKTNEMLDFDSMTYIERPYPVLTINESTNKDGMIEFYIVDNSSEPIVLAYCQTIKTKLS